MDKYITIAPAGRGKRHLVARRVHSSRAQYYVIAETSSDDSAATIAAALNAADEQPTRAVPRLVKER